jgi:hypothetical protein
MKKLFLFITFCFTICLSLILCELLLNHIKYKKIYGFYDFAIDNKSDEYHIDKNLIYSFRDDKFFKNYKTPTAAQKTIAMIGDSVTYSYGADNDNSTYPLTFEKLYNQKHPENTVSVYNYGVPGYGIDQEYILIKNKVLKELNPSVIVWNINENDINDNNFMCLYKLKNNKWEIIPATQNIGYWYGWFNTHLPSSIADSKLLNYSWSIISQILTGNRTNPLYTFGCSSSSISSINNLTVNRLIYFINDLQNILKQSNSHLIVSLVPFQQYFDDNLCLSRIDNDFFFINETLKKSLDNFIDFNETIVNKLDPIFFENHRQISSNCQNSKTTTFTTETNLSNLYFLPGSIDRNPNGYRHPNQKMYDLMASELLNYSFSFEF